jgi:peptidoglycan/xylan/chitin deacetylase (PgdA/CDA1 family)
MTANGAVTANPLVVTVNVEVESHDALVAGGAGLFGRYSYGRYGAREGVWRLLDTFKAEGVEATFFVDADDAERHPHIVEAILAEGHEVAHLGPPDIEAITDEAVLRQKLTASRDKLAKIAGRPVLGWRAAAGTLSVPTLPLLAELGYLYDSSFQDDDQPYLFGEAGGPVLVELPTFKYLTDGTFFHVRRTDETVRKTWAEEFVAMHAEGSYIALTISTRGDFGSGRALRTRIVGEWIGRAARTPGIEMTRCDRLAERCKAAGAKPEPFPWLEEFERDNA